MTWSLFGYSYEKSRLILIISKFWFYRFESNRHEIYKINLSELTPLWGQFFFKSTPKENTILYVTTYNPKDKTPKSTVYRAIVALKPPRVPKTISNQNTSKRQLESGEGGGISIMSGHIGQFL